MSQKLLMTRLGVLTLLASLWSAASAQGGLEIGPPPAEVICEFPELRTPPTLREASRTGVAASLVCAEDASAEVKLLVTRKSAKYFKLGSRVIGSGRGGLLAGEREDVIAFLRLGAIEKLGRTRGEIVYFKAKVTAENAEGTRAPPMVRFGQFSVGH